MSDYSLARSLCLVDTGPGDCFPGCPPGISTDEVVKVRWTRHTKTAVLTEFPEGTLLEGVSLHLYQNSGYQNLIQLSAVRIIALYLRSVNALIRRRPVAPPDQDAQLVSPQLGIHRCLSSLLLNIHSMDTVCNAQN